ncbi:MAG: response regulator transcription factor [Candidatus Promineifilaceae bacterium]|nr:response regulator transcription factor [Candidatus Promineifilaceae bacterium]
MTIRIIIAEDHNVVRTAVASYLSRRGDIEVVGEVAEGGAPLFEAVETLEPDLLLLDAHMPGHDVDVIESARQLRKHFPDLTILVLSAYDRREYVVGLLKAGAAGYVLKDDSSEMLLRAIRTVVNGGEWVSPRVANILVNSVRNKEQEPAAVLSKREVDVLRVMARGYTNSKIAEELFITEQTVKNHVSSIFSKLGVETRVEAVLYALRHGLASPESADDTGV